jgi:arsenate reductase (glutaredoxin)
MTDCPVTIFHNPACGTSRKVVALVEAAGYRPEVVEYLKTGWTRDQLIALFAGAGITAREALRETGSSAGDLGLLQPAATEAAILDAMIAHPVLVNRPIVRTPRGVALCRPAERVLELLDVTPDGPVGG